MRAMTAASSAKETCQNVCARACACVFGIFWGKKTRVLESPHSHRQKKTKMSIDLRTNPNVHLEMCIHRVRTHVCVNRSTGRVVRHFRRDHSVTHGPVGLFVRRGETLAYISHTCPYKSPKVSPTKKVVNHMRKPRRAWRSRTSRAPPLCTRRGSPRRPRGDTGPRWPPLPMCVDMCVRKHAHACEDSPRAFALQNQIEMSTDVYTHNALAFSPYKRHAKPSTGTAHRRSESSGGRRPPAGGGFVAREEKTHST